MSRYLSYLRKKMHGGQVDTERDTTVCEAKSRNKKIHRLKQNNVAPCDTLTSESPAISKSTSIVDFHCGTNEKPLSGGDPSATNSFNTDGTELCSGNSDNDSLLDNQSFGEVDFVCDEKGFVENEEDEGVHNDGNDELVDDVMEEAFTGLTDNEMLDDNNFDSGFPCSTSPFSDEADTTDTNESDDRPRSQNSSPVSPERLSVRQSPSKSLSSSQSSLEKLLSFSPSLSIPYDKSISQSDMLLPKSKETEDRHKSCPDFCIVTQTSHSSDITRLPSSEDDDFQSALDSLPKSESGSLDDSSATTAYGSSLSEESYDSGPHVANEEPIASRSSPSPVENPLSQSTSTDSPDSVDTDVIKSGIVDTVSADHAQAELRLAQKRAARAEAREMRLKELEKTQQEEDNEEEQQYEANSFTPASNQRSRKSSLQAQNSNPKTPTRTPTRSSAGRASLANSNNYSRRSSEGSSDEALPSSAREIKTELKEVEEKFRKAMITNAQLDNEKSTLTYEVEFIKDKFTDLEETHLQLNKEHRKKCSENEQLRKLSNKLKEEVKMVRKVLQERDELIQEYGLVVVGEEQNGDESSVNADEEMEDETINNLSPRKIAIKKALLSQEAAELLAKGATCGSLDVRLKKYAEEKHELEDEVRRLRMELEEELHRRRKENGLDNEKQKEASKSLNDYKLRIQKSEAEVSTLQATVARLESLVSRYKSTSEELEKSEEELKLEKRKLMRELRDAQNRLDELEVTNSHLQKRFEKLKNARSNLLKDISQDPA